MNKHAECYKGYTVLSKSWYGENFLKNYSKDYVDEVDFGFYHPEGGTTGELIMRWYPIDQGKPPSAKLEAFDDTFTTLATFPELWGELAKFNDQTMSVKEFCEVLERLGFKNRTETKNPYEEVK